MGTVKSLIRIIIITATVVLLKPSLSVRAYPIEDHRTDIPSERMIKPPEFPYLTVPPGYTSSALLCPWASPPWWGGWLGRACAGPVPPFKIPTSTTTTEAPSSADDDGDNPYADYGNPIEGSPWEPDDEEIFLENYGIRAANPNFRLGDPSRYM